MKSCQDTEQRVQGAGGGGGGEEGCCGARTLSHLQSQGAFLNSAPWAPSVAGLAGASHP